MGSRTPAQKSLLSTCPDRRQIPRLQAWRAMTHAIDPAVLADQSARAHAVSDLGERHAGAQQLCTCHYTVRRSRDPGEFLLCCPVLMSHYDT